MLHLLDTPYWRTAQRGADLPHTLPGWTLAFLAVQADWVTRDRLCTLLWPEAAAAEGQHNLRVNLYRVRALLAGWDTAAALVAERKRVRLQLPTDLQLLKQALAARGDPTALATFRPALLPGMDCPGFPALQEWLDLERAALHGQWRVAVLAHLAAGALVPAQAADACHTLLAADPLDEEALTHQLRLAVDGGQVAQARHLFQLYRTRLQQDLGAAPSPALAAWMATVDARPAAAAPAAAPPSRDAFVGRALELAQVQAMLDAGAGHIVTLTGPGGVGKSRLARELAQRCAATGNASVPWVALADLADAAALLPRLAAQLGLNASSSQDMALQVSVMLAQRPGLVVLDNAEHLPDLPALLAQLQQAAPLCTWLVTSRVPLLASRERTYTLEGLARPEADEQPAGSEQALAFDAVHLLDLRARALNPGFSVGADWAACVGLVRATGGWPLAIELAAAALVHDGAAAVLASLRQSIDTLAAGQAPAQARHDSMRASLALSWRLLQADEQAALACLSVCRGGFTRPAAAAVADSTAAVLARLQQRSWVQVLGAGRCELHPLVAQFAAEQLAPGARAQMHAHDRAHDRAHEHAPEHAQAAAMQRHAAHYMGRLVALAQAGTGDPAPRLQEIDSDLENFRQAWAHTSARGSGALLAQAARAWSDFGSARGRARELAGLVAAAMPATAPQTAQRLALLQAAAILHFRGGELDSAQALAREALGTAAAVGDEPSQRAMLNTLALALKDLGRYAEAEQCAHDGVLRCRAAGVERELTAHLNTAAMLAKTRGDHAHAAALYDEAIAIHRRHANPRSLAICLNNLGNVHRALHNMAAARSCFDEALRVAEQHGIASTRAYALVNLGAVHQRDGKVALALSFAERARADPAAEIAVLMGADVVSTLAAIDLQDWDSARTALCALALRARQTGLHAALLEAVHCHARLLAAQGGRSGALARLAYLSGHAQLPAMLRSDIAQALVQLAPTAAELTQAQMQSRGFELDILIEDAVTTNAARRNG